MNFALRIFAPFGFAYVISYALRTVNAAIAPQLTAEFGLDAAQLGLLTAAYFLSFSFTQIPLGSWLDRFRPRRVESVLLLFCAAGCFVFASATSSTALIIGRALIGVGVAACLMATIRTFGLWLAATRLPAMNGYMLAVGNAGAILSTAPALWILQKMSWQQMFVGIGVFTLIVAAVLAFLVPDPPVKTSPQQSDGAPKAGWSDVLKSPLFWAVAPITCVTNAVGLAVQGLWAGPWLVDVARLAPKQIGDYLLLISVGMLFANIALGKWMGKMLARGFAAPWFAAIGCVGALCGQLPFLFSWTGSPAIALACFGLTHVSGNLVFAAMFPHFASNVVGRLSTTLNFLMFGTGFLLQWGIGLVVNQYPAASGGRYLPQGYELAFAIIAAIQIIIVIWTFFALPRTLAMTHLVATKAACPARP
jgi:predicted MFS family arabinose efflux permease